MNEKLNKNINILNKKPLRKCKKGSRFDSKSGIKSVAIKFAYF